jgi:hypothetical protein
MGPLKSQKGDLMNTRSRGWFSFALTALVMTGAAACGTPPADTERDQAGLRAWPGSLWSDDLTDGDLGPSPDLSFGAPACEVYDPGNDQFNPGVFSALDGNVCEYEFARRIRTSHLYRVLQTTPGGYFLGEVDNRGVLPYGQIFTDLSPRGTRGYPVCMGAHPGKYYRGYCYYVAPSGTYPFPNMIYQSDFWEWMVDPNAP